jgi:superfamily I DNA/RNA helicase
MGNHYVFTLASLQRCLELAPSEHWFATLRVPEDGSWAVLAVETNDCTFVLHRADKPDSPRIIVISQETTALLPGAVETLRVTFQRIHRVALSVANPPLRLPPAWKEFHHQNLVAFFAGPYHIGPLSLRWIAEIHPHNSNDICFWKLTGPGDPLSLPEYKPRHEVYERIVGQWKTAFAAASQRFAQSPTAAETVALEPAIDLEATTFGPVTQYRSYSIWLDHLTPKQREFVEWSPDQAVKLKGPAGTGKTLALELKILREVYRARDEQHKIRALFATHSWAVAQQIDAALHKLDESGNLSEIDVFPLLEISRSSLPADRQPGRGFELLGEDSLAGRRLQLRRIDAIVDRLAKSDWLTYRRHVSAEFRSRVEAQKGSPERNALVWDLMLEFSSVLSVQAILPGINAERRYLALHRAPWMMPLDTDADKRFVMQVYTKYVDGLKEDRLLTSDQLINDFLSYLETFTWNLQREEKGYDFIFVDELHLFSEQERLVLNYLTRSASKYPKIFMALDPRQAPSEVYAGVPGAVVARGESGRADLDLGSVPSLELSKVHRFTVEILALVQHIHRRYPTLGLGPDWQLEVDSVESAAGHGPKPLLFVHLTQAAEVEVVSRRVEDQWRGMEAQHRIAVILVDSLQLPMYQEGLEERLKGNVSVIQSRDEVEKLRYSRRSVVVGPAEYLAGLQFDYVVIAGMSDVNVGAPNSGHQRRRLLSQLYVAISRATRHVEIHANDENGGVPNILETALGAGVIDRLEAGY